MNCYFLEKEEIPSFILGEVKVALMIQMREINYYTSDKGIQQMMYIILVNYMKIIPFRKDEMVRCFCLKRCVILKPISLRLLFSVIH